MANKEQCEPNKRSWLGPKRITEEMCRHPIITVKYNLPTQICPTYESSRSSNAYKAMKIAVRNL